MSDHRHSAALATSALMGLISRGQAMQAAVLRQASPEELETMRREAHDVLDAYLDHTTQAATAVRSIIEP